MTIKLKEATKRSENCSFFLLSYCLQIYLSFCLPFCLSVLFVSKFHSFNAYEFYFFVSIFLFVVVAHLFFLSMLSENERKIQQKTYRRIQCPSFFIHIFIIFYPLKCSFKLGMISEIIKTANTCRSIVGNSGNENSMTLVSTSDL